MNGINFPGESETSIEDIGQCVESLGRIPQLWISYSGYFREVKAMCLAVRYSIEHENFHAFQKNMTQYHTRQSILLRRHQDELVDAHQQEITRLGEIQNLYSRLVHETTSLEGFLSNLRISLASISDETAALAFSSDTITQQNVALSRIQEENKSMLKEHQYDFRALNADTDIVKDLRVNFSSSQFMGWNYFISTFSNTRVIQAKR
ncbi:hypothetical protein BGZ76_000989 [Entomortierella beljakovae]|nr:hypothetical protein BGZ76_000989 [Entomortierella beljakovae]